MKYQQLSQGSSTKSVAVPDYNKAYRLVVWKVGSSNITIPDNGWIYVWGASCVVGILLNSEIMSTPTVAPHFAGSGSSIIPVYKGQNVYIRAEKGDGYIVWFIPIR